MGQVKAGEKNQKAKGKNGRGCKWGKRCHRECSHEPYLALVVAVVLAGLTFFGAVSAWATTRCVPNDSPGGCAITYATIQAAIDAAAAGDTIKVAAGTYTGKIVIGKPVVLEGPNAGISPNTGVRVAEAVITGSSVADPIIEMISGDLDGLTIDGFTISNVTTVGQQQVIHLITDGDNVVIRNNRLLNNSGRIFVSTPPGGPRDGLVITDNLIDGMTQDNQAGMQLFTMTNCEISNNVVKNTTYGGIQLGSASNCTISGNEVENVPRSGIAVDNSGDIIIENNTVTNAGDGQGAPATDTGNDDLTENGGITLYNADQTNVTVVGNTLSGNHNGVTIRSGAALGTGIVVQLNSITGNTLVGINNEGTGTLNAENNWWGCTGGPDALGCDTVSDNVDFDPFLGVPITSGGSATVPSDSSGTASNAPDTSGEVGTTATLTNTGDGSGSATVNVATYASNPGTGGIIDVGGGFVDLQVTGADANDTLAAKFYYPDTVTGANEAGLSLLFFTGLGWLPVRSSGNTDPIKNTTDNLDGTVSGGRFSVTFDNTSTPKITDLAGTEFTMNQEAPIPTLPQWGMILLTLSLLTLATWELAGQPALFGASATGGVVTLVNHRQLLSSFPFLLGQGLAGLGLLLYAALIAPLVPHDAVGALLAGLLLGAMVEFYRRSRSL